jgi:hypothetical protein
MPLGRPPKRIRGAQTTRADNHSDVDAEACGCGCHDHDHHHTLTPMLSIPFEGRWTVRVERRERIMEARVGAMSPSSAPARIRGHPIRDHPMFVVTLPFDRSRQRFAPVDQHRIEQHPLLFIQLPPLESEFGKTLLPQLPVIADLPQCDVRQVLKTCQSPSFVIP